MSERDFADTFVAFARGEADQNEMDEALQRLSKDTLSGYHSKMPIAQQRIVPRTKLVALEAVASAAETYLNGVDKHVSQLELWRNKPIGSKAATLYDEHTKALDGFRSLLQDALQRLDFHEDAYGWRFEDEL